MRRVITELAEEEGLELYKNQYTYAHLDKIFPNSLGLPVPLFPKTWDIVNVVYNILANKKNTPNPENMFGFGDIVMATIDDEKIIGVLGVKIEYTYKHGVRMTKAKPFIIPLAGRGLKCVDFYFVQSFTPEMLSYLPMYIRTSTRGFVYTAMPNRSGPTTTKIIRKEDLAGVFIKTKKELNSVMLIKKAPLKYDIKESLKVVMSVNAMLGLGRSFRMLQPNTMVIRHSINNTSFSIIAPPSKGKYVHNRELLGEIFYALVEYHKARK